MSIGDTLAAFIRFVLRDVTYHKLYPATVQRTDSDGTAEVLPDDEEIRGTGLRADILPGIPGTTIEAAAGARALVGFRAGDPRRPYIAEWGAEGLIRMGFKGGAAGFARVGDVIDIATLPTVPVSGLISGTLTVPGTPPVVTPLPPTPFAGTATITTPVQAQIQGPGNPKLLA